MVNLAKKQKGNNTYLYLEKRVWKNGKSVRAWQIYLGPEHSLTKDFLMVREEDIETETIEFGLIAALLFTAKKLGVVECINEITKKRKQGLSVGEHLLFAAINRCVEPVSKSQLKRWFDSTALGTIYPDLNSRLDSRTYWTHFKYLTEKNVDLIGEALAKRVHHVFGVKFNDLLFDPTNFFTYINPKKPNQTLPRHGHSKEGRPTLNLVNFSLFCALDGGIPFLHLVYPGNVQDATHFKSALQVLVARLDRLKVAPATITLSFDKGTLSKDAFKLIDSEGFHFIASIRPSTQKHLLSLRFDDSSLFTLPNGKKVGVKETTCEIYGKSRRIVCIYDPKRAHWLIKNFEANIRNKIKKINDFFEKRLNSKRWSKQDTILKKCKTIVGSKKFQTVIHVDLTEKEGVLALTAIKNDQAFNEHMATLGKSFLMTNRTDMDPLSVVWAYRQQYVVEQAFKLLKNQRFLSIRPMHHRVDSSVRGHSFACFFGLLLLTLLVRDLVQQKIPISLPKMINRLKSIKLTRITIPGKQKTLIKVNSMNKNTRLLYDTLKLQQFL